VGRKHEVLGIMSALIQRHWLNGFVVILGMLTALILFPVITSSVHWIQDWYDEQNPVVTAKLVRAEHVDPQTLRLQFLVTRNRDCEFIRLLGMTGNGLHDMQLATSVRREDGSDPISYPPGLTAVSRPWLLSPVFGPRLMLWGYYDCDDRVVRTRMLDEVIAP
jgi:hypothetical protein